MTYGFTDDPSQQAVVVVSDDGKVLEWDKGARNLFGWEPDEVVGLNVIFFVPENLHFEVESRRARFRQGRNAERLFTLRLHKDGRLIPVVVDVVANRGDAGALRGFIMTFAPIPADRLADVRFGNAIDAAPVALIVVDADGMIQFANRIAEDMFGYAHLGMAAMNIDLLTPAARRATHAHDRAKYVKAPIPRPMGADRHLLGQRADGSTFPVEVALSPVVTALGIQVVACVLDITTRLRSEETLLAQAEALRQSNAELEQFAYVASHDLKEPLRVVASFAQLLSEKYAGQLDERANRYIDHIVGGARRMQGLVADLLSYSRLSGQTHPRHRIDLNVIVADVLAKLSGEIAASGAVVDCAELPEVESDETELGQIFQNLVSNAIKFHGTQPPHIRIGVRFDGGETVFYVTDNGIGIDPRFHARVFLMFQRLHDRGKYEGSGVGLAIVKKVVEKHGGRIWIESTLGHGSTFFFTLCAHAKDKQ